MRYRAPANYGRPPDDLTTPRKAVGFDPLGAQTNQGQQDGQYGTLLVSTAVDLTPGIEAEISLPPYAGFVAFFARMVIGAGEIATHDLSIMWAPDAATYEAAPVRIWGTRLRTDATAIARVSYLAGDQPGGIYLPAGYCRARTSGSWEAAPPATRSATLRAVAIPPQ